MAIEGTLDDFALTDILQMVAQQQKTGILTIQGEATIVAVSFLGGRIVGADSLEETVEERLGEVLVRQGLLSREAFSRVVQEQREGKGRLVDLLVEGGYLDRAQVLESLHHQTTELLGRLVEWERGEFKFYANDEVAYEEGFRPIAVDDLLLSLLPEEPAEAPAVAAAPSGGMESGSGGERLAEVVPLPTGAGGRGAGGTEGAEALSAIPGEGVEEPDWREVSWSGEELGSPASAGGWPTGEAGHEEPPGEGTGGEAAGARSGPAASAAGTASGPVDLPVDLPVEEVRAPDRSASRRHPARAVGATAATRWAVAGLGLLLAATLFVALLGSPGEFLLPMPWQEGELQAYRSVQRQARYQAIDSAAKTFFLKEVRFPGSLDRLVELSLLLPEETVGPEGRRLELIPGQDSYELRIAGSPPDDESAGLEAITGDFLLDPDFLAASEVDRTPPLVLLD